MGVRSLGLVCCAAALIVGLQACERGQVQLTVLEEGRSDLVLAVVVRGLGPDGNRDIIPPGTFLEFEAHSACDCYKSYGGGSFTTAAATFSMYFERSAGSEFQVVCRHPLNSNPGLCVPTTYAINFHRCDGDSQLLDLGIPAKVEYQKDDSSTDRPGDANDSPFSSARQGTTISLATKAYQGEGVYRLQLLFRPTEAEAETDIAFTAGDRNDRAQVNVTAFNPWNAAPDAHQRDHGFGVDVGNINVVGGSIFLKVVGDPVILCGIVLTMRGPVSRIRVATDLRRQTLKGIGVNMVFYLNWLTEHRNKDRIYNLIFRQLRPQVLRIRNDYGFLGTGVVDKNLAVLLEACSDYMGYLPVLMMGSWGAPKELQANGTSTLNKDDNGEFPYAKYAQYWMDSLDAYQKLSVIPNIVFIQNEPDYHHGEHETTRFGVTESSEMPGFGKAANLVYQRFTEREYRPPLIGPDTTGLNWSAMSKYFTGMDMSQFQSYSHHYYSGGDWDQPDDFVYDMDRVSKVKDKDKLMTEYARWVGDRDIDDYFKLAWMIHNAMTIEEVNMYNHWDLFFEPKKASLVGLEYGGREEDWQTIDGYTVHKTIYTLMLWTRFVPHGWSRVSSNSSLGELADIRASAFIHPHQPHDTTMVLNFRSYDYPVELNGLPETALPRSIYCTSRIHNFTRIGILSPSGILMVPPRSNCAVTTLRA